MCVHSKEALETRLKEKEKGVANEPEEQQPTPKGYSRDGISPAGNDLGHSSFSSNAFTGDFSEDHHWMMPLSPAQRLASSELEGLQDANLDYDFLTMGQSSVGALLTPIIRNDLYVATWILIRAGNSDARYSRDQLYFDRAHVFTPMLQKFRYLSWSKQLTKTKEKTCLQYSMWSLAASLSSQFHFIQDGLYAEARKLLDDLDAGRQEADSIPLEQVQAWILLSIYEFTSVNCQRGQVSTGRAFRLAQLMKLHEIDTPAAPRGQGDWIDIESARRTFWIAFIIDRFTSVYDTLPLTFNEHQVSLSPYVNTLGGYSGDISDWCLYRLARVYQSRTPIS